MSGDQEVVIRLSTPADLFRAGDPDMFSPSGRLLSGMEELVQELLPGRLRRGRRVAVVLPAEQVRTTSGDDVRRAVQRYCHLRLRQADLGLRAQRREVITAMGVGGVLFVAGLWLSYYFVQVTQPTTLQVLLGNGVFLVVAWVGLWYPLDTLVFSRRPLFRERRVLAAILTMELTVREDDDAGAGREARRPQASGGWP